MVAARGHGRWGAPAGVGPWRCPACPGRPHEALVGRMSSPVSQAGCAQASWWVPHHGVASTTSRHAHGLLPRGPYA